MTVAVPRATRHRWDEHNLVDSIAKPIVDGIVDAGVVVPGDHTRPGEYTWVVVAQPRTWYGTGDIRVRITHAPEGRWDGSPA